MAAAPAAATARKSALTLEKWLEILEKILPAPRRRRTRRSPVPYPQWIGIFKIVQRISGYLIREAEQRYRAAGKTVPRAFGAILRIALVKHWLKKIHEYAAAHKGIENPEEILRMLKDIIEKEFRNPELVKQYFEQYIRSFGIPPEYLENYVKTAVDFVNYMKPVLEDVFRKVEEQIKKAEAGKTVAG